MQIHVVQSGESLWLISRRYGVSVASIVAANELPSDFLIVGQSLLIPTPGQYHSVQPGESLWIIASKYGTTVQELAEENQLTNPSLIYPGQVLTIPERKEVVVEVNAYTTQSNETGAQQVYDVGRLLTYISPFSYEVRPDGSLVALNEPSTLESAREERVAPLMVITNFTEEGFSSELAHDILASAALQELLIDEILETIHSKGYRGLNIDFEYVLPDDRELYNQFLRRVTERLHREGFLVSSAVAPKLSATQRGLLYEAHDYPVHGEVLDFVILMTYEWGWAGGPPRAVAPLDQVRGVLDYARSVIPPQKIMMGIPLYGRDWTLPYVPGESYAPAISPQEALRRARQYLAAIQYDTMAQSPFFNYVDEAEHEHEVWFEDARSIQAKFNLLKAYGLRGCSYWVLGNPFPQNWLLIEDNFNVRKLT